MRGGLVCDVHVNVRSIAAQLRDCDPSGLRRFFDQQVADLFEETVLIFRVSFNDLAQNALNRGLPRYHMRPKIHMMDHVAHEFKGKNPRYFTNYLGEDAVRRVKRVAARSPARHMSHHVMYRYCVSLCLAWR